MNAAEERFHSGSYQTYLTCDCSGRKQHQENTETLRNSIGVAENNIRILELKREITDLNRGLSCKETELNRLEEKNPEKD